MTTPLPPLNEPNSDETERNDGQQTRPNVPIRDTPPNPMPRVQAPVPQRGAHVQPLNQTGQQRRVPPASGYQPRVPPPKPDALYLPWWSVVAMLLVVLMVAFGIVGLVLTLGATEPSSVTTPIIRIITAVPTIPGQAQVQPTQAPIIQVGGNNPPSDLALSGPTLEIPVFTPTPAPIVVGSTVVVSGVEETQLNVRDVAGVQGTNILFRVPEGTSFSIIEGPTQADGFTWWKIQNPTNPSESGWAVANYLQVVVSGQ
jgi:hypothetical protein